MLALLPLALVERVAAVMAELLPQVSQVLPIQVVVVVVVDTLAAVDASVGKARQVLATMSRRITQNKVIMWGVIALLAGAIGLVVWAKIA